MTRVILGLFLAMLIIPPAPAEVGEDGLHKKSWFAVTFKDVAEDIADAESQGKRLAMIFEQRGCIYCRQLHEGPLSDPEVVAFIKSNFVVVQYNRCGDARSLREVDHAQYVCLGPGERLRERGAFPEISCPPFPGTTEDAIGETGCRLKMAYACNATTNSKI